MPWRAGRKSWPASSRNPSERSADLGEGAPLGHLARVPRLAGQRRRDPAPGRARHPCRVARRGGTSAEDAPPASLRRALRAGPGADLGLGRPTLRAALARELGRRRSFRPAPFRTPVAQAPRVGPPGQPAWRPNADPALPALALLRVDAALSQHRL